MHAPFVTGEFYNRLTDPLACDLNACGPSVCENTSAQATGACTPKCTNSVPYALLPYVQCSSAPSNGDTCSCPAKSLPRYVPANFPSGGAQHWQVEADTSRLTVEHRVRDDSTALSGHVITRIPCDSCDMAIETIYLTGARIDLGRDKYEFSDIHLNLDGPVIATRQPDGSFLTTPDTFDISLWYTDNGLQSTTEIVDRSIRLIIDPSGTHLSIHLSVGLDDETTATIDVQASTVLNTAPVAVAAYAASVECTGNRQAVVSLDARTSFDVDGDPLEYLWVENFRNNSTSLSAIVLGREAQISHSLSLGAHNITLRVTDGRGAEGLFAFTVNVVDTQGPTSVSATIAPDCLWPPNKRWHAYTVGSDLIVSASDVCTGQAAATVTAISTSESGQEIPDGYQLASPTGFCLQSDRSGAAGRPRLYQISGQATDPEGNSTLFSVNVTVPHNQNECTNTFSATDTTCTPAPPPSATDAGTSTSGTATSSALEVAASTNASQATRAPTVVGCAVSESRNAPQTTIPICVLVLATTWIVRRRWRKS